MRKKVWLAGLLAAVLVLSPFAGTLKATASTVSGGDLGSTVSGGDSGSTESGSVVIDGKEYFFADGKKIQGGNGNSGIEGYLFDEGTIFYVTKPGRGMGATLGCAPASSVKKFVLADGIESIGNAAFGAGGKQVRVTSIEIPASVKSIGSYAFFGWNTLTEIKFLGEVETIGSKAFSAFENNVVDTTVIVQNDVEKNYDWAADRRTVTIIDQRAAEQSGEASEAETGSGPSESVPEEDEDDEVALPAEDGVSRSMHERSDGATEVIEKDQTTGGIITTVQESSGRINVTTSGQKVNADLTIPEGVSIKQADGTVISIDVGALRTYVRPVDVDSDMKNAVLNPKNLAAKGMSITTKEPYTMDLSLTYHTAPITELTGGITFTVKIPEDANIDFSMPIAVVRVHDWNPEVLDTSVNVAERTITFTTDVFSVYGVVNVAVRAPKTGDALNLSYLFAVLGSFLLMGACVWGFKRKRTTLTK